MIRIILGRSTAPSAPCSEAAKKQGASNSRVVIAGYDTDLEMEELNQRVAGTLKKYLNKDFDWDSQRYRLAERF